MYAAGSVKVTSICRWPKSGRRYCSHTQRLRVRLPIAAQPGFVVESDTLHDQRVAVPAPDRVSHPARRGIRLQLAAVHEDQSVSEVVVQDRNGGLRLEDALPSGKFLSLGPTRQTLIGGAHLVVLLQTLADDGADPRLCGRGVEPRFRNWPVPYPAQIRLAVGPARRRRGEVRLAVRFARDARSGTIQPLGAGRHRADYQHEHREKQPHTSPPIPPWNVPTARRRDGNTRARRRCFQR